MNSKFLDYLSSIGGGTGGGIFGFIKFNNISEIITFDIIIHTILITIMAAFIGATIGYFTKCFWDKIFKK